MPKNHKVVYLIRGSGERSYWTRQGVAFVNKDGSLNVSLDLFPGLTFHIRDPRSPEDAEAET